MGRDKQKSIIKKVTSSKRTERKSQTYFLLLLHKCLLSFSQTQNGRHFLLLLFNFVLFPFFTGSQLNKQERLQIRKTQSALGLLDCLKKNTRQLVNFDVKSSTALRNRRETIITKWNLSTNCNNVQTMFSLQSYLKTL